MSEIIEQINALMRDLPYIPRRQLRCGRTAWDVLRSGMARAGLGTADPLFGVPVHIDPELTDGAWQLLDDGQVVQSGDMTPGHRRAIYISGVGLFGISDEVADVVQANIQDARERAAVTEERP